MNWCDLDKMILRLRMFSSKPLWPYLDDLQKIIENKPNQPISANRIQAIIKEIEISRLSEKDQLLVENLNNLVEIIRMMDTRIKLKKENKNNLGDTILFKNFLQQILFNGNQEGLAGFWEMTLMELSKTVSLIHNTERREKKLQGALYEVSFSGYFIIIGDMHGDIYSFWQILENESFFEETHKKVIFLGDYIDNGSHQLPTLFLALFLKVAWPERVYLLKGNHEQLLKTSRSKVVPTIQGENMFFDEFREYLSNKCLLSIFNCLVRLPVVIQLNKHIGFVHGGLPRPTGNHVDFFPGLQTFYDLNNPTILYEMIWNRPVNKSFAVSVSNDSDFETSQPHFESFMGKMGWHYLIRGHCPQIAGFNTLYDERMFTIYSTGNAMSHYSYIRPVYAVLNADGNGDSFQTTIAIKRVYKPDDMDHNVFAKELTEKKVVSDE